ncbi:hypothetical protein SLA2020_162310 [Shorea laevis]
MDRLRRDMEQSRGETVVLSTGLKDKDGRRKSLVDPEDEEEEEEEEEDDDYERFSEEEDVIDEDEDEEVARFSL